MKPLVAAVVLVALAIAVPYVVRLRIRFFKWIHWTWAVRVTEEYFESWILRRRAVLLVLPLAFLFFCFAANL